MAQNYEACLATVTPEPEDSIRTEQVQEVIVTSNSARQRVQNVQMGEEVIQIEDLTSTPQLFGENDIMRSIQLLPGVKSESDASSSFQVRGGTSAQNQVLFDNAPIYNAGHAGGLFSTFNDDALAGATLYKPSTVGRLRPYSTSSGAQVTNSMFTVAVPSVCCRPRVRWKDRLQKTRHPSSSLLVARTWTCF